VRAPDAARSLTLARAFELLNHALSELGGGPVGEEPLRARMAALHGREDALLEPARFQRLLRQANDAEVADVRKTDDDTLEVTAPRIDVRMSRTRADAGRGARKPVDPELVKAVDADVVDDADGDLTAPPAPIEPAAPVAEIPVAPAAASAAGATRMGLRFRRGSRSPVRGGGVPLVGAVASSRAEPGTSPTPAAATPAATEANGAKPPVADAAAKPAADPKPAKAAKRGGRAKAAKGPSAATSGRKPAKAAKTAKSAPKAPAAQPAEPAPAEGGDAKPARPRRARPRARKAAKE
jgi:histone H1/5